ncbi:MAG: fatty acid desaturase [Woeseiaceae bacterium]
MTTPTELKDITPEIIQKYSNKSNLKALFQILNTFIPYFALFYFAIESFKANNIALTIGIVLLLALFIVRVFMIMHDCGHKSLFKTQGFNVIVGFFSGVVVGIPQYVWSKHHNYHHATNGDWEKYKGPLNVLTTKQYEKLTPGQQLKYKLARNIFISPVAAFLYFIFNPRFNWMLGSLLFIINVIKQKVTSPSTSLKNIINSQESRFWKTSTEYLHMTLNNIVLISIWGAASLYFGATAFFTVYVISLSLAGAAGLLVFTLQHNFEDSYASDTEHWSYYQAALTGTSFYTVPKFFNWFGADIAYHHVHHLSAGIPNYNLAACHKEYAHLFEDVKRIRFRDVTKEFKFILWDKENHKIISIKQFEAIPTT